MLNTALEPFSTGKSPWPAGLSLASTGSTGSREYLCPFPSLVYLSLHVYAATVLAESDQEIMALCLRKYQGHWFL